MATVQVRMDEDVKVRFEKLADEVNKKRKKNGYSKLNTAQVLELAVNALAEQLNQRGDKNAKVQN